MSKRRSKEVGGFEEALQRAKRQAAAAEFEKKRKKSREQQAVVDADEAERLRVLEVQRSPEWRQMVELSRDPEFLKALETYYNSVKPVVVWRAEHIKESRLIEDIFFGERYRSEGNFEKVPFDSALVVQISPDKLSTGQFEKVGGVLTNFGVISVGWKDKKTRVDNDGNDYDIDLSTWFDITYLAEATEYEFMIHGVLWGAKGSGSPAKYEKKIAPKGLVVACKKGVISVEDFYDYIADEIIEAESRK